MARQQPTVQSQPGSILDATRVAWQTRTLRADQTNDELPAVLWNRVRRCHPLTLYRALAYAVALAIMVSHLHAESTVRGEYWAVLIGALHLVATAAVVGRLPLRPTPLTIAAVAIDGAICVLLVGITYGWQGPFWLYSLSAVFWPAFVFPLPLAIISVAIYDAAILLTNTERIRTTFADGFGGDLAARLLMVFLIAGAISLTARTMAVVRVLATEAERNRIARDLHDGVGKTLGGISLEARSLAQWIERDPAEARRRARYVTRISERAAMEVRDVIRSLRQSEATEHLLPAVSARLAEWSEKRPEELHVRINGPDNPVPILIHSEVLRMLDELLSNIEQHAEARNVWVRLTLSSVAVTLAVRDDGVGFDRRWLDPWADDGHFGLLGARERASILGGHFDLQSAPGTGAEVTIDIPLTPREERPVHVLR
ncbi:MAG TPA: sensor histidine kinase [Thermomicrobiales bacterium]|nr:sensor histidine kinase [Thermomicrobiales bacterium]